MTLTIWEYKCVDLMVLSEPEKVLNACGLDGWEAFAISGHPHPIGGADRRMLMWMKRQTTALREKPPGTPPHFASQKLDPQLNVSGHK